MKPAGENNSQELSKVFGQSVNSTKGREEI